MKISVIIPIYNAESFLPACLDSVLAQTYQDLEIILINDGSTDGSGVICDRYASADNRIQVIHQENCGVSCARNRGLKLAEGELISFVDSDDTMEPDMYEFLVQLMQEHDADISHCGYKRYDKQGKLVREVNGTHRRMVQNGEEAINCMLRGDYFSNGLWNKLFRHYVVQGLQFQEDLKNNEDVLFCVQAFSRAKTAVFQDDGKYHYYDHPSSACNSLKARKQNRDAIEAGIRMLPLVVEPETKETVYQRIYSARVNQLRWLVRNPGEAEPGERQEQKMLLEQDWKRLSAHSLRQLINHLLLTRTPALYRLVYRAYDACRTPNWDAKG